MQLDRLTPGFRKNVKPSSLFSTMYHVPEDCFHAWTSANIRSFTYCLYISFYPYISLFLHFHISCFSVLHFSVDFFGSCLISFPRSSFSLLAFFSVHSFFIFPQAVRLLFLSSGNTFFDLMYFPSFHLLLQYCICYNCLLTSCSFVSSYTTNPTSFVFNVVYFIWFGLFLFAPVSLICLPASVTSYTFPLNVTEYVIYWCRKELDLWILIRCLSWTYLNIFVNNHRFKT
jgi:hypothetical protein